MRVLTPHPWEHAETCNACASVLAVAALDVTVFAEASPGTEQEYGYVCEICFAQNLLNAPEFIPPGIREFAMQRFVRVRELKENLQKLEDRHELDVVRRDRDTLREVFAQERDMLRDLVRRSCQVMLRTPFDERLSTPATYAYSLACLVQRFARARDPEMVERVLAEFDLPNSCEAAPGGRRCAAHGNLPLAKDARCEEGRKNVTFFLGEKS